MISIDNAVELIIKTPEFDEFVGPFVVSTNYRLLLHFVTVLLAKAQSKDEYEPCWLAEQLSLILQWYWGDEAADGYLRSVSSEYREAIEAELEESAAMAGLLVALTAASDLAHQHDLRGTLARLASVARRQLLDPPVQWPQDVIDEAMWASATITARPPEHAEEMRVELQRTIDWESRDSFLRRQVQRYRVKTHQAYLEELNLKFGPVPTLAIEDPGSWTPADVEETMADFMRFRSSSNYSIRLLTAQGDKVATLICRCGEPSSCVLLDHNSGKQTAFAEPRPAERPWDAPLLQLFSAAS
jgi:hypothetical protein